MNSIRTHIPSIPERLGKADTLLREASLRLEVYRNDIDLENYLMAQGLLTITREFRFGLEDKWLFGRYHQAQAYLDKVQETYKRIEQLISGLY